MNKQTIDLDVITGGVPQVLHVAQYDTGARTLEFNIYSSNNDLDLTGATAKISGRKADGLGFEYPATITDGVVVADCTDQMTAVAGIVECAITLTNSEGQIQTARFDLNVKPAPLNDDTVISDSDFPLIQQAIGAEEDAEAWAVGTRNGEPVPVSDPTYENNAKYWAEQAEQTDIGQIEKVKVSWNDAAESVQKNLNSYPYNNTTKTQNGITFTDLGDGRIRANGTATADTYFGCHLRTLGTNNSLIVPNGKYIFNGCPAGGAGGTYAIRIERTYNGTATRLGTDIGNGVEITLNGDDYFTDKVQLQINIVIRNGATVNNLIFSPMLRKATIKDDTWEPYIPNNTELTTWKANGVLGAKNLIPCTAVTTTQSGNLVFTVNDDGSINVNGTSTQSSANVFTVGDFTLKAGTYLLSGTPDGAYASNAGVRIQLINKTTSAALALNESPEPTRVTIASDIEVRARLWYSANVTVTNKLFKPMLRLAEDTDDTYQPYAMTNYELTQKIADLQAQINALI